MKVAASPSPGSLVVSGSAVEGEPTRLRSCDEDEDKVDEEDASDPNVVVTADSNESS